MTANTSPIFVAAIKGAGATWTNSDAANTKKTLLTAGTNGTRVASLGAVSSDTSDRDFVLYLNDGSTDFRVGNRTVPLGAGTGSTAGVNLLGNTSLLPWVSSDGSFLLPAGWSLKAENATQVTSAKTITLVVLAGDY